MHAVRQPARGHSRLGALAKPFSPLSSDPCAQPLRRLQEELTELRAASTSSKAAVDQLRTGLRDVQQAAQDRSKRAAVAVCALRTSVQLLQAQLFVAPCSSEPPPVRSLPPAVAAKVEHSFDDVLRALLQVTASHDGSASPSCYSAATPGELQITRADTAAAQQAHRAAQDLAASLESQLLDARQQLQVRAELRGRQVDAAMLMQTLAQEACEDARVQGQKAAQATAAMADLAQARSQVLALSSSLETARRGNCSMQDEIQRLTAAVAQMERAQASLDASAQVRGSW